MPDSCATCRCSHKRKTSFQMTFFHPPRRVDPQTIRRPGLPSTRCRGGRRISCGNSAPQRSHTTHRSSAVGYDPLAAEFAGHLSHFFQVTSFHSRQTTNAASRSPRTRCPAGFPSRTDEHFSTTCERFNNSLHRNGLSHLKPGSNVGNPSASKLAHSAGWKEPLSSGTAWTDWSSLSAFSIRAHRSNSKTLISSGFRVAFILTR